jgi:PEP-CTERM motif
MFGKIHLKRVFQLKHYTALGAGSVVVLVLATGASHALPAVQSYEYFGVANPIDQSFTPGTLDYDGKPGCNSAGTCSLTTSLGASPSAFGTVSEVIYQGTQGGYVEAELSYFVEDVSAPGTVSVTLHASDSFAGDYSQLEIGPSQVQSGQAYLAVGIGTLNADGESPTFSSYLVNETDCITRCSTGVANYLNPAPFPGSQTIVMQANTPYLVNEWVVINPWPPAGQLSAFVDSSFTGGALVFSPGISGVVPEPSTWAMMLLGFAGLGWLARKRGRKITPA